MTKYCVSFTSIIEADTEQEAIEMFWNEADGAMPEDAQCYVYRPLDNSFDDD